MVLQPQRRNADDTPHTQSLPATQKQLDLRPKRLSTNGLGDVALKHSVWRPVTDGHALPSPTAPILALAYTTQGGLLHLLRPEAVNGSFIRTVRHGPPPYSRNRSPKDSGDATSNMQSIESQTNTSLSSRHASIRQDRTL